MLTLLTMMLLTGMFVANFVGQWWLRQWHRLMSNIPIVKSIYTSVKQVSDTLFSSSGNAFREAVLVQYPRQGSWTIAFVTGAPSGEVARHLECLRQYGDARMSGSGACVFLAVRDAAQADAIVQAVPPEWRAWKAQALAPGGP